MKTAAVAADVLTRQKGRVGRKKIALSASSMKETPYWTQKNIRKLAHYAGMPKSTLHHRIAKVNMTRTTNNIKPHLTEANNLERLKVCMYMINPTRITAGDSHLNNFVNVIQLDEKWFYITEITAGIYLLPVKMTPHCTAKYERFNKKVMFKTMVAASRYDAYKNKQFDENIGVFSFVFSEKVKWDSHRSACKDHAKNSCSCS